MALQHYCLCVLSMVVLAFSVLLSVVVWQNSVNIKNKVTLVIGVLSARDHFHQREAIRETWLHDLLEFNHNNPQNQVLLKFVIGDTDCAIHPSLRENEYSCDVSFVNDIEDFENKPMVDCISDNHDHDNIIIWNVSIRVKHAVRIKRLGILDVVNITNSHVKVILWDNVNDRSVVETTFSTMDEGIVINNFRYQPIRNVILPSSFEGSITVLLNHSVLNKHCSFTRSNFESIIKIGYLDDKGFPFHPVNRNVVVGVSMFLSLFDSNSYQHFMSMKTVRDSEHKLHITNTEKRLREENAKFADLLFVNLTDTYRNLPVKLLKFHQWIRNNVITKFVLKTDDDCFVDLQNIMQQLSTYEFVNKLWWSNFRIDWYVEQTGKWAEHFYKANSYPPFACGAGNIVSTDVSDWLAINANLLHTYQGEDTSMGIWLAAICPQYVPDERWKCDKSCNKDAFVIPQLTVEELKWMWDNKVKCENPCGC